MLKGGRIGLWVACVALLVLATVSPGIAGPAEDRLRRAIDRIVERPALAERICQNTLHDAPCPHCGHTSQVDAPLLLYRPGEVPSLIFSPAQNTDQEQDREHAAGLVERLDWRYSGSLRFPSRPAANLRFRFSISGLSSDTCIGRTS